MKWRTRKTGETRERIRFLWLPVRCNDGFTRWLERMQVLERVYYVDWRAHWFTVTMTPLTKETNR
jgi:hypothetical protein